MEKNIIGRNLNITEAHFIKKPPYFVYFYPKRINLLGLWNLQELY